MKKVVLGPKRNRIKDRSKVSKKKKIKPVQDVWMLCSEDGRDITVYIQSDTQIGSTSLQQEQNGNSMAKMHEGSEMKLYQRWKQILKIMTLESE